MYSYQASSSKKYTSIALTLLIHLLLIMGFFYEYQEEFRVFQPLHQELDKVQETKPDKQKEDTERAELIQRGGAPVIFQDFPEYKEENINQMTYNPVAPRDEEKKPEQQVQMPTQIPQKVEEQKPEKEEEAFKIENKKNEPHVSSKEQKIQETTPQNPAKTKPIPSMAFNTQTQKTTAKRANINPGDGKKNASQRTKQLTFADILEGFAQMLKKGNNDWMSQKGAQDKDPSFQDLKTMSYMQKLGTQLRASWNMGIDDTSQKLFQRGMKNFKFALSIAKNGDILDLQIAQSTGIQDVDALLLQIIRSSSPFPPVPDHLNMQVFNVLYELMFS